MFPGRGMMAFPMRGYSLGIPKLNFNWASFLTNAGKTLNVVNQAIPVFYQIGPIYKNVKTMFRVANEFRKPDEIVEQDVPKEEEKEVVVEKELRNPVFFK